MSINCLSPSLELPPAVYSSLLPLTRPLLHPPSCVLGVLGSSMPFPAHSDCVLRDEFSHLFITNSLVFLPKLGNVSTAWLHSWRSMPPKNATNIYLPASLSSPWWYLTPCFSSKSWQWVIKYPFSLTIIFKKCHAFLCCRNTVQWEQLRSELGPVSWLSGLFPCRHGLSPWGQKSPPCYTCGTESRVFLFVSSLFRC